MWPCARAIRRRFSKSLDFDIRGEVAVECDRCLEDCTIPVHFDGELVVHISEQADEYDGENMWVSPEEEDIGLMQYIYESIVLSLPYRRVHPDGGCNPDMMARFTAADDTEAEEASAADGPADGADTSKSRGMSAENLSKLEELKARMQERKS